MLYVGAVEGIGYLAPKQVYRMGSEQAALSSDASRLEYATESIKSGFVPQGKSWYADTTREPIRDEAIRQGLLAVVAAVERQGISTTSPLPRYALTSDFAKLFDPALTGGTLDEDIASWQTKYFDKGALAQIAVVKAGASKTPSDFIVEFPNGDIRAPSSGLPPSRTRS